MKSKQSFALSKLTFFVKVDDLDIWKSTKHLGVFEPRNTKVPFYFSSKYMLSLIDLVKLLSIAQFDTE